MARDAVSHPLFARAYARLSVSADLHGGVAAHRKDLLSGLSGRVLEVGAGNGLNFAHYPSAVSEVVAIEPERLLRESALRAAVRAGVPVDVVPGAAEALPVKSEAYDAVVFSLVLCSVRNVERALAEARRVLRPGGELRFFEHGRDERRSMATLQRGLDRTVWPLLFGNCHTSRDPVDEIRQAGFTAVSFRRVTVPEKGLRLPTSACVLGVAQRPGNVTERP
ncbi:class I SAM-dependent methyltransferase [Streptomyces candidus]|uniref:class I SAM-dependent methyltransferase n=1 Tax=Streptomyces candidus TaxID=67283 RepID=UPI001E5CE792|nr:class I SAM-dependent methyltransferase [Streptomyces candidus]